MSVVLAAILACFFAVTALGAIVVVALVAPRSVPPITGTWALIMTLAALGVAVLR